MHACSSPSAAVLLPQSSCPSPPAGQPIPLANSVKKHWLLPRPRFPVGSCPPLPAWHAVCPPSPLSRPTLHPIQTAQQHPTKHPGWGIRGRLYEDRSRTGSSKVRTYLGATPDTYLCSIIHCRVPKMILVDLEHYSTKSRSGY